MRFLGNSIVVLSLIMIMLVSESQGFFIFPKIWRQMANTKPKKNNNNNNNILSTPRPSIYSKDNKLEQRYQLALQRLEISTDVTKKKPLLQKTVKAAITILAALTVSAPVLASSTFSASTTTAAAAIHPIGWKQLSLAWSFTVCTAMFGLAVAGLPGKIVRDIIIATGRSTIQLYMIGGYLLSFLILKSRPWIVSSWITFTGCIAAYEAKKRVEYTYPQLGRHLIISFLLAGFTVVSYAVLWNLFGPFTARTWIPVSGMLFGNSLMSTSLAAATVTRELATKQQIIELQLCQGATWKEALTGILKTVYTTALTPVINFLSVAGIVHIPGMMTGQILAGQDPLQAAAYQLMIFFLVGSTTCLTTQTLTNLSLMSLIDHDFHRLRSSLLKPVVKKKNNNSNNNNNNKASNTYGQVASFAKSLFELKKPIDMPEIINGSKPAIRRIELIRKVELKRTNDPNWEPPPSILSVNDMLIERTNTQISLSVRYDDRIAIVGPSGIGKTQFLRTLVGFESVSRDSLCLFDIPSTSMSMAEWRSHILLIPQGRPALEGTPNDFYHQSSKFASQRQTSTKNVIAGHRKSIIEYGIEWGLTESTFDQPWSTLSGGEAQRCMIAIALALQPDVLLLDESMNALDDVTAQRVEATLKNLRISIIMVSHSNAQIERFCNHQISFEGRPNSSIIRTSTK